MRRNSRLVMCFVIAALTLILPTKFPVGARGDIQERFKQVIAQKKFDVNDVEAVRDFVKSYVTFIHYVEHLYEEMADMSDNPPT